MDSSIDDYILQEKIRKDYFVKLFLKEDPKPEKNKDGDWEEKVKYDKEENSHIGDELLDEK